MKTPIFRLTVLASALLTTGCVSQQLSNETRASIQSAKAAVAVNLEKATPPSTSKQTYEKSQEVDAPWIVGKSVPLARSVTLPQALQKDVKTAIMFGTRNVSLSGAAERIMLATNMVVTISPDVYLDASALQRKAIKDGGASASGAGANGQGGQSSFATMPVGMPTGANPMPLPLPGSYGAARVPSPTAAVPVGTELRAPESAHGFDMPSMNAPLSQILDIIATKLSIKWKYDEASNSLRFYRMVTKTWETPFRASKTSYKSSLEGQTTATNNTNALNTQGTDQSPIDDEHKDLIELNAMKDSVDNLMTRSGSVYANPATGQITATDTPEVIEAADTIIKDGVRAVSRLVKLRMQTIKVTSNNTGEFGLDVSAAVSRALASVPDFTLSLGSPTNLASANAGNLGLQIFSGSAAGSRAIATILKDVGDVDVSTAIPLATRNRKAVYYTVGRTFSYVSSTTPAAATTGGTGGTPGITTAQDQVGLKLFMYPEVTSKDTIMLTVTLDQSTLQSLETFSSGSGPTLQSVQLPEKDRENSQQQVPIRNGQTIVLTGFDTETNQYDKRTLGDNIPVVAGGSLRASKTRTSTIVLVTAEVADGTTD